jgi:hypothetical protein
LEKSRPISVSAQVTTIANLRWRMFVNGLRSRRGKMELLSRVIVTLAFTVGGFGGFAAATGFGTSSRRISPNFFPRCCGPSFSSGKSSP